MDKVSASKIVALRVAKVRAKGRGKGSDGDQVDLFEAEGGRKYSRQYQRSKEKELQSKGKGGGSKVFGKARFSSRSEAGRYAANMRWKGQGQAASAGSPLANSNQAGSKVGFTDTIPGYASDRYTHFRGLGFDGQVMYMIGNEGENPRDLSFNFALQTPNKGFIGETIQGSDWSSKVMYSSSPNTTNTIDETKALTVEHNQALGRLISERLKTLKIREIAQGIEQEYKNTKKTIPRAVADAISQMKPIGNINDYYAYSTGQKVVSDALKSLASFNSEIGKLVRTELRSRVKNAVPKPPSAGLRRAQSLPFNELRP